MHPQANKNWEQRFLPLPFFFTATPLILRTFVLVFSEGTLAFKTVRRTVLNNARLSARQSRKAAYCRLSLYLCGVASFFVVLFYVLENALKA